MPERNILILALCQLISATGAIIMVTLGGITGAKLAGNPALATLPVSMTVASIAATTIPATIIMGKIGRKYGFALASLCGVASVLLAAFALYRESFSVFVVAAAAFGINLAFSQQYRYAAAESVPSHFAPRAISFVLLGAIGGAMAGPELFRYGEFLISDVQYAGTLIAMSAFFLLQSLMSLGLGPLRGEDHSDQPQAQRPLGENSAQPLFSESIKAQYSIFVSAIDAIFREIQYIPSK